MSVEKAHELATVQAKAIELRRSGMGYAAIAQQLGYAGPGSAHKAVHAGLVAVRTEAGSEELRSLEAERLDELQASRWEKAINGDDFALDRVLKIMKRRAELLGLDAPVKHEVAVQAVKGYDVGNPPEAL